MKRRSDCPLSSSLEIFGDKWTLILIRDMGARGKKTFKEFLASNEGISTNILTNRLNLLVSHEIVTKTRDTRNKLVFNYELTPKGKELRPIVVEIGKWGYKYIPGTIPPK